MPYYLRVTSRSIVPAYSAMGRSLAVRRPVGALEFLRWLKQNPAAACGGEVGTAGEGEG